jgi:hypothetical protein
LRQHAQAKGDTETEDQQAHSGEAEENVNHHGDDHAQREHFGRAIFQIRLVDVKLETAQDAQPGYEITQKGQRSALLPANQIGRGADARASGDAQFAQTRGK